MYKPGGPDSEIAWKKKQTVKNCSQKSYLKVSCKFVSDKKMRKKIPMLDLVTSSAVELWAHWLDKDIKLEWKKSRDSSWTFLVPVDNDCVSEKTQNNENKNKSFKNDFYDHEKLKSCRRVEKQNRKWELK